ncbi:MAG TPA: hypothetical protein VIV66_09275 [Pyrinomonadaceae bacterium]
MRNLYAMQRANGDWFAFDDHGFFRMPVFHNSRAAMISRSRHSELECFRPVIINHGVLEDLRTAEGKVPCFWMVDDPSLSLKRSRPMDFDQFTEFMRD